MEKYNGYANYDTWNVALWILNDEGVYRVAKSCKHYNEFADKMNSIGEKNTLDGVRYGDCLHGYGNLDTEALDDLIRDL